MRRKLLFLLLLLSVTVAFGQEQDICSHLHASGRVLVRQDERLTDLVGSVPHAYTVGNTNGEGSNQNKIQGYRIRVYSGNRQSISKNRCIEIQKDINDKMPELTTYVIFKNPNWRIMVGDYRTSEEAQAALHLLKHEFPAYAKEMFVIKETINL